VHDSPGTFRVIARTDACEDSVARFNDGRVLVNNDPPASARRYARSALSENMRSATSSARSKRPHRISASTL
jgi:hypothetical protein